jgi:hypothetical protein
LQAAAVWLGWPGRAYGKEGLVSSALRKFSRQLQISAVLGISGFKKGQFGLLVLQISA